MKPFLLLYLRFVSVLARSSLAPSTKMETVLQPILDSKAEKYDCGMSMSVILNNGTSFTLSAGSKDADKNVPVQADDKWVWGSCTKMLTGASIMKLIHDGVIGGNDKVVDYVDPYLKRLHKEGAINFTSLTDLYGSNATDVTIVQLATMTSGIPDFDTAKPEGHPPTDTFRASVYSHPKRNLAPSTLISEPWIAQGELEFYPGSNQDYSSTNFVLLGLVLAQVANVSWQDYNQFHILDYPGGGRKRYPSVQFAKTGAPKEYTDVRGYDRTDYNGQNTTKGVDVSSVHGVLSGFTASDFIGTTAELGRFVQDLYGPKYKVLPQEYVQYMVPNPEGFYGFSTFNLQEFTGQPIGKYGDAYGHLGATYGYQSVAVYYPGLELTLAIATNIETTYQVQAPDVMCTAYNRLKNLLLDEPVDSCQYYSTGYWGLCACDSVKYSCAAEHYHNHTFYQCYIDQETGSFNYTTCTDQCGNHSHYQS